jgi:hypothetical protein
MMIMAQSNALKKYHLNDFLYPLEVLQNRVHVREHLFAIKHDDEELGYIALYDLKTLINEGQTDFSNFDVRQADLKEWRKVYEHPHFQRRKLELILSNTLLQTEEDIEDDQEYFLLIKGQKSGPYKKAELISMVDSKEAIVTDLVSNNGGHPWVKLYQVEGIDRRSFKESDELPGKPKREIFEFFTDKKPTKRPILEALTGLAYLGQVKKGSTLQKEQEKFLNNSKNNTNNSSNTFLWAITIFGAILVYTFFALRNSISSPFGVERKNELGEKIETNSYGESEITNQNNKANNSVNDSFRSPKMIPRTLTPVRAFNSNRQKSYTESQNFKDSTNNENSANLQSADDQNYYYADQTPVELDPVKSQVSKETMEKEQAIGEPVSNATGDPLLKEEVEN